MRLWAGASHPVLCVLGSFFLRGSFSCLPIPCFAAMDTSVWLILVDMEYGIHLVFFLCSFSFSLSFSHRSSPLEVLGLFFFFFPCRRRCPYFLPLIALPAIGAGRRTGRVRQSRGISAGCFRFLFSFLFLWLHGRFQARKGREHGAVGFFWSGLVRLLQRGVPFGFYVLDHGG